MSPAKAPSEIATSLLLARIFVEAVLVDPPSVFGVSSATNFVTRFPSTNDRLSTKTWMEPSFRSVVRKLINSDS